MRTSAAALQGFGQEAVGHVQYVGIEFQQVAVGDGSGKVDRGRDLRPHRDAQVRHHRDAVWSKNQAAKESSGIGVELK